VPTLLAEVTQVWEIATAVEVTCATAMLPVDTSAREAVVVQDSTILHVKDVEDRAALVEREALERVSRAEAENATTLTSTHEDAEVHAQKIALLEDKLAAEHRAWEVSEREPQKQFEDLTLLQTHGSTLYHAIIGPPRVRHHLSEVMRLAALHHTSMVGELVVLWAVVSTAADSVLGSSPSDTFRFKVVREMAAKFQKMED
jgi:hypothetical protein